MPRLSLWRENHSNDYKFFDRRISEMFTVGGTGIYVHKYLGTSQEASLGTPTQPKYDSVSEKNIQDLLFLENRDRVYDTTVYHLRGVYQVSDSDFDLTQFGLFLATGTLFMTFHINDMVNIMGRRIMSGDVLELAHLKDYDALSDVPTALKRFFVVGDCQRASEGFSPTWWPHLWRCKINPLVDSQEYKNLIAQLNLDDNGNPVTNILSTYDKYLDINSAIVSQAEQDLPYSGYDTTGIFVQPLTTAGTEAASKVVTADTTTSMVDATAADNSADIALITPDAKVEGWLTGDGIAPNGLPVTSDISFPAEPSTGDYCLRVDYFPNRLFRYDGKRWVKIEDAVRSGLTGGASNNKTLRNSFINNNETYTDDRGTHASRQGLSTIFKPKADN